MNEIVQVVKMADVTIRQRLDEFKRTPSAQLSLSDFQSIWLEEEYEPPAFYRPAIEEEKRKKREEKRKIQEERAAARKARKRAKMKVKEVWDEEESPDCDDTNDAGEDEDEDGDHVPHTMAGRAGVDSRLNEGFGLSPQLDLLVDEATRQQIEAYTNDPEFQNLDSEATIRNLESQRRAKLGGAAILGNPSPVIDPELLKQSASQTAPRGQEVSQSEAARGSAETASKASPSSNPGAGLSSTAPDASALRPKQSDSQHAAPAESSKVGTTQVGDTLEDLDEDELDQFILGPEEVKIKERVWMEFNHDYLQEALKRQLKEEADEKAGIRRRAPRSRKAPPKPRDSSTAQGTSAIESARQMMQKKAKTVSKKLNYDVMSGIEGLFGGMDGSTGYGQQRASYRSSRHKRKRHDGTSKLRKTQQYDSATGGDTIDAEMHPARTVNYFDDDHGLTLEVIEEEGDALPSNHPLQRGQSKAERENKKRKQRGQQGCVSAKGSKSQLRPGDLSSGTSDGEESGTEIGTQQGRSGVSGGDDDDDEDYKDDGYDEDEALVQDAYRTGSLFNSTYGDDMDDTYQEEAY